MLLIFEIESRAIVSTSSSNFIRLIEIIVGSNLPSESIFGSFRNHVTTLCAQEEIPLLLNSFRIG
jgi:hypothetical protein